MLLCAKLSVKAVRIPRVKDLPCIAWRDSSYLVTDFNSCLHKVYVTVIGQKIRMVKRYPHYIVDKLKAVSALILDIMDSEHGLYVLIALLIAIEDIIVNRHQSRLPVIGIYYLRLEVDISDKLEHCP